MIDQTTIQAMIAQHNARMAEEAKIPLGPATELKCGCGGVLHEFDGTQILINHMKKLAGSPRYSKKTRLKKKFRKAWRRKPAVQMYLMQLLVAPLRNPRGYKCASCGMRSGFYQAMAKNMFTVQPLPEGAKPFYSEGSDGSP